MFGTDSPICMSGILLVQWIYVVGAVEGDRLHGLMYTNAIQGHRLAGFRCFLLQNT